MTMVFAHDTEAGGLRQADTTAAGPVSSAGSSKCSAGDSSRDTEYQPRDIVIVWGPDGKYEGQSLNNQSSLYERMSAWRTALEKDSALTGRRYLVYGDGKQDITLDEFKQKMDGFRAGSTAPGTTVFIAAHGLYDSDKGDHYLLTAYKFDAAGQPADGPGHIERTSSVFEVLRHDDSTHDLQVYLHACHSGAAHADRHALGEGSTLACPYSADRPGFSNGHEYQLDRMTASLDLAHDRFDPEEAARRIDERLGVRAMLDDHVVHSPDCWPFAEPTIGTASGVESLRAKVVSESKHRLEKLFCFTPLKDETRLFFAENLDQLVECAQTFGGCSEGDKKRLQQEAKDVFTRLETEGRTWRSGRREPHPHGSLLEMLAHVYHIHRSCDWKK